MEMIPGPQALILLVKFPSRCSSTCVIVRGMKHGMNLLLFLIRLHNSAERQVRAMSYFIYAEWKTSWSKANVGSGSGWGQIGPGAASLPQETGAQAPWQVEVLRLELLFCCSFVPHPRQHFYEYLQMRGTHLSDNPCFPWVWISDVEHLHILPLVFTWGWRCSGMSQDLFANTSIQRWLVMPKMRSRLSRTVVLLLVWDL